MMRLTIALAFVYSCKLFNYEYILEVTVLSL